jgi:hypothetical protein
MRRDQETAKDLDLMISISRVRGGDDPYIAVEITDDTSGMTFVRMKLSLDAFAEAVTGLSYVHGTAEVNGLDRVGKKHEHKEFLFSLGKKVGYSGLKEKARKKIEKVCPKGWTPDTSFNSQNSFFEQDDEQWARCTIRRWV